jgi:hypothetical protein
MEIIDPTPRREQLGLARTDFDEYICIAWRWRAQYPVAQSSRWWRDLAVDTIAFMALDGAWSFGHSNARRALASPLFSIYWILIGTKHKTLG